MERTIVVKKDHDFSRLFLKEEFSIHNQSLRVRPIKDGVQFLINASDSAQLDKAGRAIQTTAALYRKMRGVVHGD